MKTGLFCFTHDLRLHDNPALSKACMSVDTLICHYHLPKAWCQHSRSNSLALGEKRQAFTHQSVNDLAESLHERGQQLIITNGDRFNAISELIEQYQPSDIFYSEQIAYFERNIWQSLKRAYPHCQFHSVSSYTLFDDSNLPFKLDDLPTGFHRFREKCEQQQPLQPMRTIDDMPTPPALLNVNSPKLMQQSQANGQLQGGEQKALSHLNHFFNSEHPAHYKVTRNALDGWTNSTKLSPWLSTGCLSVRKVFAELKKYEQHTIANESTYWIYFELLWREYFQWFALKHGNSLFRYSGVVGKKPLNSYYGGRLMKWINGETPYPLVNALMNELKNTGYMSNRGRQIVVSCFINELSLDWRFGAAYFEQMLIDYDPAANWGNWQYLAGVGAKNVAIRHFNIEKQTQQFDPNGSFIGKWDGQSQPAPLDSVDAADWPIA